VPGLNGAADLPEARRSETSVVEPHFMKRGGYLWEAKCSPLRQMISKGE
jgi:hypothetical protein